MALVVWIVTGTALWHFSVLVPDRFYGGIIGAFLAANAGAIAVGFLATAMAGSLSLGDTGLVDVFFASVGAAIALAGSYLVGERFDPASADRSS
jgi:uncharacterized membrane protein